VGAFGRKKAINGNFGELRLMAWKAPKGEPFETALSFYRNSLKKSITMWLRKEGGETL
jgi:hypothetical protein